MAQPILIEAADDHPSTSPGASGQKVSEQRYKPYGEVRWSSGAGMPTDPSTDRITGPLRAGFTFTGQRAGPANYVGSLMDYNAWFFSPALGRFVSADTIVPGAGNPAAFNRYMYVLGRPLSFGDPDGHCTPLLVWLCYAISKVPSFFALAPDIGCLVQPIANASLVQKHASDGVPAIELGAAIAVQAEYCCSLNDLVTTAPTPFRQEDPSLGITQVRQSAMNRLGIPGTPYDLDPAIQTLSELMRRSIAACSGCDATDKFIVAGMAHNGDEFGAEAVVNVLNRYRSEGGPVDWGKYFAALPKASPVADNPIRLVKTANETNQAGFGARSWKLQLLRKFTINADALRKLGWDMPSGVDMGYLVCLVNDGGTTCKR